MSSRKPTAPGATRSPKQTTAPEQTPASTKKYNFTKTILPAWEKTRDQKLRSCSRLEIVDKGLEVVVNALDELPDSSQKQIIAKTLLKMQTLLDKELEVKRFEAAQSQHFTNALSGDSTVLCNNVGFNSIAVLLQVLNHEDKDAKVRHVLAAVQANMTMASVLPDDKMDAARNRAITRTPEDGQSSSEGLSSSVPKSSADRLALKDTTNKKKDRKFSPTGYDFKAASQPKIRTKTKVQMDAGEKLAQQHAKDIFLFGEPIDDKIIAATVPEDQAIEEATMDKQPEEETGEDDVAVAQLTMSENVIEDQLTVQPAADSPAQTELALEVAASVVLEPETSTGGTPDTEMEVVGAPKHDQESGNGLTEIEIKESKTFSDSKVGSNTGTSKSKAKKSKPKPKAQLSEDIIADRDEEAKSTSTDAITEDASLLPQSEKELGTAVQDQSPLLNTSESSKSKKTPSDSERSSAVAKLKRRTPQEKEVVAQKAKSPSNGTVSSRLDVPDGRKNIRPAGMPGVAVTRKSTGGGSTPRNHACQPQPEQGNKRKRVGDHGELGPNKKPAIEGRYIAKPKTRRPAPTAMRDMMEIDSVPSSSTTMAPGDTTPLYRPHSTLQMAPIDWDDDEL